jgi:hypothetical protein
MYPGVKTVVWRSDAIPQVGLDEIVMLEFTKTARWAHTELFIEYRRHDFGWVCRVTAKKYIDGLSGVNVPGFSMKAANADKKSVSLWIFWEAIEIFNYFPT